MSADLEPARVPAPPAVIALLWQKEDRIARLERALQDSADRLEAIAPKVADMRQALEGARRVIARQADRIAVLEGRARA